MAAFGTKKPFGDIGLAATFPYNFQQMFRAGVDYFPSGDEQPMQLMEGNNFQSEYHELKRLEANERVANRGQNNRTIQRKLMTGPHNFHLPKPVLGQRKYANPSMGADSYSSTRRDNGQDAPFRTIEVGVVGAMGGAMRGGVLTTREGYDFYKNKLNNRIGEINSINSLAVGNVVPMGQDKDTYDNTKVGPPNKVEFFILLRGLEDAITEGDLTRFTFENLKELVGKLFNMAPSASVDDFNDVIDAVDIMLVDLEQGLSEIAENTAHNTFVRPDYANTLSIFMEKIKRYTDQMMKNVYMSERDKTTLSKSLVKSLGFDRLLRNKTSEGVVDQMREQNARVDQEAADNDDGRNGGDDGRPTQLAPIRENEEQAGVPRQPLAGRNGDPNRDRYGAQAGAYAEPLVYYLDGPGFAAPLDVAGAEQIGVPAQRDPTALVDAAEAAVGFILEPQTTDGNRDLPADQLVEALYPMPSNFVSEVTDRLEEQGFSPAEIAYGLSQLGEFGDIFNEYINENQGPLDQAAIAAPDDVAQFGEPQPGALVPVDQQRALVQAATAWNYPPTREALRAQLNTIPKIQAFGATIPREYGGPYKPRSGSYVKSAHTHIIKLIRQYVDPNY